MENGRTVLVFRNEAFQLQIALYHRPLLQDLVRTVAFGFPLDRGDCTWGQLVCPVSEVVDVHMGQGVKRGTAV